MFMLEKLAVLQNTGLNLWSLTFLKEFKVNDLKIAEQLIIENLGLIKTKWNEIHGF